MAKSDAQGHGFLAERGFAALHLLCNFGHRRSHFGVSLQRLDVIFGVKLTNALFLCLGQTSSPNNERHARREPDNKAVVEIWSGVFFRGESVQAVTLSVPGRASLR